MDDYLETVKNKRQISSQSKTEQDKLEAFTTLAQEIRSLLTSLETAGAKQLDKKVVEAIARLDKIVNSISTVKVTSDQDIKTALLYMAEAIRQIDVKPVINLPPPKVELKEREIDFQPIIEQLGKHKPSKALLTLSDYKAQDMNELDPNIQYIGFVNPAGRWYIIENNTLDNTLRYKFGRSGYPTAWKKPQSLNYKLLNEAVREA